MESEVKKNKECILQLELPWSPLPTDRAVFYGLMWAIKRI